jgi:hypothetical protein
LCTPLQIRTRIHYQSTTLQNESQTTRRSMSRPCFLPTHKSPGASAHPGQKRSPATNGQARRRMHTTRNVNPPPDAITMLSTQALATPITIFPPTFLHISPEACYYTDHSTRSAASTEDRYLCDRHAPPHGKAQPSTQRPLHMAYVSKLVTSALVLIIPSPSTCFPATMLYIMAHNATCYNQKVDTFQSK